MDLFHQADSEALCALIAENEDWLIDRILHYAKRQGYVRYAPTLREAWRQVIAGLSNSMIVALKSLPSDVELEPDEDYTKDTLTQFGILEAMRHRDRGVDLRMFLGLLKYCRQSFMDLIDQRQPDPDCRKRCRHTLKRFFDRIEIGLVTTWQAPNGTDHLKALQQANRTITNEKNKYLTIFESLQSPVAVLDEHNRVDSLNHAWVTLFGGDTVPGADYYHDSRPDRLVAWLLPEVHNFVESGVQEKTVVREVETASGCRYLSIKIKRMLDVSEKFRGCVIILDDITQQKEAEAANRKNERLQGALELAGAVCHDLNQPLMAITGYAELLLMEYPENASRSEKIKKILSQISKMGDITNKLMRVTRYETKSYLDRKIIDLEKAATD